MAHHSLANEHLDLVARQVEIAPSWLLRWIVPRGRGGRGSALPWVLLLLLLLSTLGEAAHCFGADASVGRRIRNGSLCTRSVPGSGRQGVGSGSIARSCRSSPGRYGATIRRTSFGIPHITADDYGSLGFGQGYAIAEDHLCTLADQIVKVRSERARFFGRGENDRHLNSDLAYLAIGLRDRAKAALASEPTEVRDLVEGYAAGYNAYLAEVGADGVKGFCRGEPWVRPISALDLQTYIFDLTVLASSRYLIDFIAAAKPPDGVVQAASRARPFDLGIEQPVELGSNGWAIGGDRSATGRGMLVANPHFAWTGELRFWESHLVIPGELDVYGGSLLGLPGVAIGFNQQVAWTQTFTASRQFTIYSLDLVPGKPTSYFYDGRERRMTSKSFTVQVLENGSLTEVRRTFWSSHYGPIIDPSGLGWSTTRAYTFRDANIDNDSALAQYLAMNRARSLDDLKGAFSRINGVPCFNTVATDRTGRAWYIDSSAVPDLSDEAIAAWQAAVASDFLTGLFDGQGVTLLDGSDSTFEWVRSRGARDPGVVPYARMPQLERRDYVFNANDSYWLANANEPLTGFSPLFGAAETGRSPRTRMNALLLEDPGSDGVFTLEELQDRLLSNRSLTAELLVDEIVARCTGAPPVSVDGQVVDVAAACDALAGWDRRFDVESRGALVFRALLAPFNWTDLLDAGLVFAKPFDPTDPLGTPSGLVPPDADGQDTVLEALARGVLRLADSGIPVDAPLGDWQFALRGGAPIPLHGGESDTEGTANIVSPFLIPFLTSLEPMDLETGDGTGYPTIFGSAFNLTMAFTDEGPVAEAILAYGQSGDPSSPHFSDQTRLFSEKRWRPVLFTEDQIASDPELVVRTVGGARRP